MFRDFRHWGSALLCATALVPSVPRRTVADSADAPWVRVRLFSERPTRTLMVDSPGGIRVQGRTVNGPIRISLEGGRLQVAGARHFEAPVDRLHLSAARHSTLFLTAGVQSREATGTLDITARRGVLQVVNALPAEMYVLGVVEPELGSSTFPIESLKAQIVASRSWILAMHSRHTREGYDFCDGPHCQAYRGMAGITPQVLAAASAVRGAYLAYGGRPIPAFYHDSCGGSTDSASSVWPVSDVPYLRGVRDGGSEPFCRFAPKAHWHFVAKSSDLERCLVRAGLLKGGAAVTALQVAALDASGRARTLSVLTAQRRFISAERLRLAMNRYYGSEVLPSTLFRVTRAGTAFVFDGRGWGHGVGMCQWGAIEMAREGYTYDRILAHYFPGTKLERLAVPIYASSNPGPA